MVQGAGQQLQAIVEDEIGEERLVQGPLFPTEQLQALPAASTPEGAFARREALRRPGRPIGSPNKRSMRMRDYIQAKGYTDPLLFFAEAISRSARDLALELGCSPLEAFQEMRHCADSLAPYLHSKMPVAVLHAGALPMIQLVDPTLAQAMFSEDGNEQLQALIEVSDSAVEQSKSNDDAIVQRDQGTSDSPAVIADHGQEGEQ